MKFIQKYFNVIKHKFSIAGELIEFFWSQKLWWMIPFIIILLIFGLLMVFVQSTPLAPLIYTIF